MQVRVDERGHLVLPPEVVQSLGLVDGASVRIDEGADSINIGRSTASLGRVYVEPTTLCNLRCRTCVRNVWDEPPGMMSGGDLRPGHRRRAVRLAAPDSLLRRLRRAVRASGPPGDARHGEGGRLRGRAHHERNPAGRGDAAGARPDRARPAVGLDRRGDARELRRRPPVGRPAAGDRGPRPSAGAAPRPRLRPAQARHRLRGDEAEHRGPAGGHPPGAAAGCRPLLGQQRPAAHAGDAGPGALRPVHRRGRCRALAVGSG